MQSSSIQVQLSRIICLTATQERDAEVMRELLAQLKNFEPYSAFIRLDRDKLCYLTPQNFSNFLR